MPNKNPDLQQKLRQLMQQYAANLPEKITALEQEWQVLKNQQTSDSDRYHNLIRGFHTLAGSAGSYGFHAVTPLCREIEDTLKSTQPPLPTALKQEIDNKLAALKHAVKSVRVGSYSNHT